MKTTSPLPETTASQPATNYVAGFLFSEDQMKVALILKLKPAWQHGCWNGIGGKIEADESPWDAMVREFSEEAGADVHNWKEFAVLNYRGGRIHFFKAHGNHALLSMTAESVAWVHVDAVRTLPLISNLRWLLPLAMDKDGVTVVAEDRS